ncbi:uncharacterized protein DS421_11g323600 [Arachis hypogaea]|nr:uncharacterized protein DS421_11g323600 [Arachis hypogaea]
MVWLRLIKIGALGAMPPRREAQEGQTQYESYCIKLTWLKTWLRNMPHDASPEVLSQYARCYILRLIGGLLITDKSSSTVHI